MARRNAFCRSWVLARGQRLRAVKYFPTVGSRGARATASASNRLPWGVPSPLLVKLAASM